MFGGESAGLASRQETLLERSAFICLKFPCDLIPVGAVMLGQVAVCSGLPDLCIVVLQAEQVKFP
jgi:hypothetical protein